MSTPSPRSAALPQKAFNPDRPLIVPIFLPHMGCPHQCLFCNQNNITGHSARLPSLQSISQQIERFISYSRRPKPYTEVSFYGGNFLGLSYQHISSLLSHVSQFVRKGIVNGIRFSTRPDTIDPKRLEQIAPFPVSTVELGAQSMNDQVLAATNRGHKSSDTRSAVTLLKQADYTIGLQLMVGLPAETSEALMESAYQIAALAPDFVRIYPTLVIKGSPLAKCYQNGAYRPLSLSQAVEQTKKLFLLFHGKNIAVIRMGLQASEELDQNDTILAGPYHPAFGHMVYASIFLDTMRQMLLKIPPPFDRRVRISANPKDISKAQGLSHQNLHLLKEEFQLNQLTIVPDSSLPAGTLSMKQAEPISVF